MAPTYTITVSYDGGVSWIDISPYVVRNSVSMTYSLHGSDGLEPNTNSAKFSVIGYKPLLDVLLTTTAPVFCSIMRDAKPFMNGIISPVMKAIPSPARIKATELTVEDFTLSKLKKCIPSTINWSGYAICTPAAQTTSIVHAICSAAGVELASSCPAIPTVVPYLCITADDKKTYYDILKTVLFEAGYLFFFNREGKLELYNLAACPTSFSDISNELLNEIGNTTSNIISLENTKKRGSYDEVRLTWYKKEKKTGLTVFEDTTGAKNGYDCSIDVESGKYYPDKDDASGIVYSTYKNDSWTILDVLDAALKEEDTGLSLVTPFENHGKKCLFSYQNQSGATQTIHKLKAVGTVWVQSDLNTTTIEINSDVRDIYEYTCEYISTRSEADSLATVLKNYYKYNVLSFKIKSFVFFDLGSYVMVKDSVRLGKTGYGRIRQINYATDGSYTYEIEAITEYSNTETTANTTDSTQGASLPNKVDAAQGTANDALSAIALRPTYIEIMTGFKEGGGTTNPVAPVISATSGFHAISLSIDKQANLTNFDHYSIQVAEAASGPWYAPRLDGGDWKADADGAASATVEFFVHANIPLAGTTEAPLPRTLYYRACRVTKGGTKSDWSNIASAAATSTNTGDIAANSITANKLAVGILSAIMAQISDHLIIDSDIGFAGGKTEDVEGNERAYLNESGISFERYANGIWNILAKLSRIGLETPQVVSSGALTIGNGTNKTRRANGFDLGIPYPSTNTHVTHFDDDYLDQTGAAIWTLDGSYALDTSEFAILSMAPFSVSGGSLSGIPVLTHDGGTGLFGSWWLDFFFAFSALTGAGVICKVGNAATFVQLSIQQTSGMEYTALGNSETYAYFDAGTSGQRAYVAAVIQKQLIVDITRNGTEEANNYTLGELSEWAHIALGVDASTGYLNGLIDMGGIEVAISRSAFNQGGSAAMILSINPGRAFTCKIDELMLDLSAPPNLSMAAAQTKSRIPWAKNNYNERKLFLDAYDNVTTNKVFVQDEVRVNNRMRLGFYDFYDSSADKGAGYYHLKTNEPMNNVMFAVHFKGYSYGESIPIDAWISGYPYESSNEVINIGTYGSHVCGAYKSTDGYVVITIKVTTTYFIGFLLDQYGAGPQGLWPLSISSCVFSVNATGAF